jgi:hypothetical protein
MGRGFHHGDLLVVDAGEATRITWGCEGLLVRETPEPFARLPEQLMLGLYELPAA